MEIWRKEKRKILITSPYFFHWVFKFNSKIAKLLCVCLPFCLQLFFWNLARYAEITVLTKKKCWPCQNGKWLAGWWLSLNYLVPFPSSFSLNICLSWSDKIKSTAIFGKGKQNVILVWMYAIYAAPQVMTSGLQEFKADTILQKY